MSHYGSYSCCPLTRVLVFSELPFSLPQRGNGMYHFVTTKMDPMFASTHLQSLPQFTSFWGIELNLKTVFFPYWNIFIVNNNITKSFWDGILCLSWFGLFVYVCVCFLQKGCLKYLFLGAKIIFLCHNLLNGRMLWERELDIQRSYCFAKNILLLWISCMTKSLIMNL